MKTIIVATDYSATANNALEFGAHLARVFKADMMLFNVYHLDVHAQNARLAPDAIDHIIKNNENRLRDLAEETARQYQISVSWISKMEETVEALANYTTAHPVDLVVMGMDSNLTTYKLFGNTTTAAIRRLKSPILVVPNDVPFKGINKILYACEHTYLDRDNHLDLLKEFTLALGAELQVFHVQTNAREHLSATVNDQIVAIDTVLENVDHTYKFIDNASVGNGIIKGVEAWQADLVVMVPHKTDFWESLVKGSATREMTLRTRVPLLILPNDN